MTTNSKNLHDLMSQYDLSDVIDEFIFYHPESKDGVDEIVNNFFIFLIENVLNNTQQTPESLVDKFWHVFISHTISYFNFCETYFGQYVHHTSSFSKFSTSDSGCTVNDGISNLIAG